MIDIATRFDEQLITDIKNYFRANILPQVRAYSNTIPVEAKKSTFERYFSNDAVISLIDASPDELETYAETVYTEFPEFAERYHPILIYKKIREDLSAFDNIDGTTGNENIINEKAQLVINEINEINAEQNTNCFCIIKRDLTADSKNRKKLNALKRIRNIILDRYKITEKYQGYLPEWTRSPFNMFNYDSFRKEFGRRLIESHDLTTCPFCANDSVEIVTGVRKTHLPALDHYLPKSKYPFFSLSINNLLPTCPRCNSSFKGEIDMFENYYHPLRDRIHDINIFNFILTLDTPLTTPPLDSLSIRIDNENQRIMNNVKVFELNALYNQPAFKRIFFETRERYELYKNMGREHIAFILASNHLTRLQLDIDRDADPKKMPRQKFKLEILRELSE